MKKRVIAAMLSLMVAVPMLFGCDMSSAAPAAGEAVEEAAEAVQEAVEEQAEVVEEAAETVQEEAAEPEEITDITIFITDSKSASKEKIQQICDAINVITEEKIGVRVNIVTGDLNSYMSQMPMSLASGESYDLVSVYPMPPINLTTMYSNSQLMGLNDLLEEYGQDILNACGDYLDAVTINDEIYMIPNVRNYASSEYWVIGQEYIDGLGLKEDFDNLETVEDMEALCEALYNEYQIPVFAGAMNEDSRIMMHGTGGMILATDGSYAEDSLVVDSIGDNLYVLAVDEETDTVYNIYDTEEFVKACEKAQEWYDKGWIYKDSAFSNESQEIICKNGAAMSIIVTSELGVESAKEASFNKPVYAKKLCAAKVTSGVISRFGWGIPSTAQEPEAAMKFANLLMTDSELSNTLVWGIEGEDWVNEDGEAAYPGGDADNAKWHSMDFFFGNAYVVLPWKGAGADNRIRAKAESDAAPISKYLGFTFNADEYSNAVAALTSVLNQYEYSLMLGSWDEGQYKEFIEKMKAAGIDEYVAAAQEQLDEWLASK